MIEKPAVDDRNKTKACIQVKICGLTRVDQAMRCAQLGADLIGLVFYSGSPRCVGRRRAREISAAVRSKAAAVGVFVNASFQTVMDAVKNCGLDGVQLHGSEPPQQVQRLRDAGLVVLKALFQSRQPYLVQAGDYDASAFLLECGSGRLPGGNARMWDWAAARKVSRRCPVMLAGGLDADNVFRAIQLGRPDAVDVSSGVERLPGDKDMDKVAAFIDAVRRTQVGYPIKKIHQGEPPC